MGERIPIGRKTLKILVVDDEPHILEVLGVPKLCKTLIEFTPLRSLSRTLLPCSDTAGSPCFL
jgi:hypothetical protein